MDLDERFRAFLKREQRKPLSIWVVVGALAIAYPIARNGAPSAPEVDSSAERLVVQRAVERCQTHIKARWRYAVPTAGTAETIVESDRVIVKQPFAIGALRDAAICDVHSNGSIEVSR